MTGIPRIRATVLSRADLLWAYAECPKQSIDLIANRLQLLQQKKPEHEKSAVRSQTIAVPGEQIPPPAIIPFDSSGYPADTEPLAIWLSTSFATERPAKEIRLPNDDQVLGRDLGNQDQGKNVTVVGAVSEVSAASETTDLQFGMIGYGIVTLMDASANVTCLIPPSIMEGIKDESAIGQIVLVEGVTHTAGQSVVVAKRLWFREQMREAGDERYHHLKYWLWTHPPLERPKLRPLATWPVLKPRLSRLLAALDVGRRIDEEKLVKKLASREFLERVPRRQRRGWNGHYYIVVDESEQLIPYFEDQRFVVRELVRVLPKGAVEVLYGYGPRSLSRRVETHKTVRYLPHPPEPGSRILILSDLGCLATCNHLPQAWLQWGREQRAAGSRLMGLFPGCLSRVRRDLLQLYELESWQQHRADCVMDPAERQRMVLQLLEMCGPALRIEPGLLRDLRHLLPNGSDASLEAEFWQHPYVCVSGPGPAAIHRQAAQQKLLKGFESHKEHVRSRVLECIRRWRKLLEHAPEVWFEEILSLSPSSRKLVPPSDLEDAYASWLSFDQLLAQDQPSLVRDFAVRFSVRAGEHALSDEHVGHVFRKFRSRFFPEMAVHSSTDPKEVPAGDDARSIRVSVDDKAVRVDFEQPDSTSVLPPISRVQSSNALIRILPPDFWKTGKPDFVSRYGTDKFGAWLEFDVPKNNGGANVTQRMRWIRAGTFLMGSPQGERDRGSDETRHEVKLSRGYWLADTACTQELWEAVTGTDKTFSHFKGDRRPVEQVSYDEVIKFVSVLAKLIPELSPALPTEAQWEYVCRAGTTTPFSFGDTITTDQVNFNGNHPYGDSPTGEYRRKTIEVKSLPPNRWGQYEMHGNVLEWCSDWYAEYSPELQVDPTGPATGSRRVVRGGSLSHYARLVRSACRSWFGPGVRYRDLGFRLLSSASAEPTEAAEVPVAEQGSEQTRFGAATSSPPLPWQGERAGVRGLDAKTINVGEATTAEVELRDLGPVRIRSNLEEIVLQRTTKPPWAVEYGRDLFGTYADFEIPSAANSPPVCQRMRWIPPGQFQMGSPTDETERFDNELLHHVTISTGFWMFDTPCTQALWLALMPGENPSYFPDLQRPVEQVDWVQAQAFAAELTTMIPELSFSLPTEAQWEYACRAGTSTAIYTGPLEILGDANAPALDEIAWYGGNSGHEFDHERAVDVSSFTWLSEKQYPFKSAGTRQVKQKRPNPYGLYDMLGNVWEWCHDWHGDYPSESDVDPMGPETGSLRVVRGGSWSFSARYVRSACRRWYVPGNRFKNLGFRLLSSASPDRNQRPNK